MAEILIGKIFDRLQEERLTIGHLKFYVESESGNQKISFTTTSTSSSVKISLPEANRVAVLINARVQTAPERLRTIIDAAIQSVESRFGGTITEDKSAAFVPGYPTPTYRIGNEIQSA